MPGKGAAAAAAAKAWAAGIPVCVASDARPREGLTVSCALQRPVRRSGSPSEQGFEVGVRSMVRLWVRYQVDQN